MDEGISERAEVAVIDLTRTREHERIRLQQQSADSEESRFTRFFKRKVNSSISFLNIIEKNS